MLCVQTARFTEMNETEVECINGCSDPAVRERQYCFLCKNTGFLSPGKLREEVERREANEDYPVSPVDFTRVTASFWSGIDIDVQEAPKPQEGQQCYKTGGPCLHGCSGQCRESC